MKKFTILFTQYLVHNIQQNSLLATEVVGDYNYQFQQAKTVANFTNFGIRQDTPLNRV